METGSPPGAVGLRGADGVGAARGSVSGVMRDAVCMSPSPVAKYARRRWGLWGFVRYLLVCERSVSEAVSESSGSMLLRNVGTGSPRDGQVCWV